MNTAQVLAAIQGHSEKCSLITQHAAKMSQVLRARAIGMLAGRMSTRAVARELNFHFFPVSCLQRRFREFGSASNRPHNHRPRATTPAQDLHIRPVHLHDRLRPPTRTAAPEIGLHNHRMSAQTVRNHLWGVHLNAQQPHRSLELTADGQTLTFHNVLHVGEVFSSRMSHSFHCSGQLADSVNIFVQYKNPVHCNGCCIYLLWQMQKDSHRVHVFVVTLEVSARKLDFRLVI